MSLCLIAESGFEVDGEERTAFDRGAQPSGERRASGRSSGSRIAPGRYSSLIAGIAIGLDDAGTLEMPDDDVSRLFGRSTHCLDSNLRPLRRFIGRVNASEVLELSAASFLEKAFRIAHLGNLERRVDKHLEEFACSQELPCHTALGAKRRNERDEHN